MITSIASAKKRPKEDIYSAHSPVLHCAPSPWNSQVVVARLVLWIARRKITTKALDHFGFLASHNLAHSPFFIVIFLFSSYSSNAIKKRSAQPKLFSQYNFSDNAIAGAVKPMSQCVLDEISG